MHKYSEAVIGNEILTSQAPSSNANGGRESNTKISHSYHFPLIFSGFSINSPLISHHSVLSKVVWNHLTSHSWLFWLDSCSFLFLWLLSCCLTSSLLLMLNLLNLQVCCWTTTLTTLVLHSLLQLPLSSPSFLSVLPPLPLHNSLHSSSTLSAPFPFLFLVFTFASPPFPLFPTFLLLLPSHITSLPPLPPSLLISVAVGSLFKCSIGEGLRFMQGQCGMW